MESYCPEVLFFQLWFLELITATFDHNHHVALQLCGGVSAKDVIDECIEGCLCLSVVFS